MVSRVVVAGLLLALAVGVSIVPSAAAQCPKYINDCGQTNVMESLTMAVKFVQSYSPGGENYPIGGEESMLGSSLAYGGGGWGETYVVVSIAWATNASRSDVPIHIELSSDDAAFDPDSMDVVMGANESGTNDYYFEVEPEDQYEYDVAFAITTNPGTANAETWSGTLEWRQDEPDGFGDWSDMWRWYWGWLVLLILVAAALGAAIRHWLVRGQAQAPRPLTL